MSLIQIILNNKTQPITRSNMPFLPWYADTLQVDNRKFYIY
jgi:hypothetical protein